MKKIVSAVLLISAMSSVSYAGLKYDCSRYVNGSYQGYITIVANNKAEAENKAYIRATCKFQSKLII